MNFLKYQMALFVVMFIFTTTSFTPNAGAGIENRPIDTDDAQTLDKGEFSFSFGANYTEANNGDEQLDLPIDLGFGITDTFEISLDIPYTFFKADGAMNSDSGHGDVSLRPEWNFYPGSESMPALSVAYVIQFSSADNNGDLGSGASSHSIFFQASKSFQDLTLHANLGYTLEGEPAGTQADDTLSYKLAAEYPLADSFTLVGEIIGQQSSDPTGAEDDSLEWLLAGVYELENGINIDAGFGTGLSDSSPDVRFLVGFSYSFYVK